MFSTVGVRIIFVLGATILPDAPARGEAVRLFAERAMLRVADERCKLLEADEKLALASGYWHIYGELLRNDFTISEIDAFNKQADAHIDQYGCEDQSLQESVAKLQSAFSAFAKTMSMDYASDRALWRASRRPDDKWRIVQNNGQLRLGLFQTRLAIAVPAPHRDYANARIAMRDPRRFDEPWLGDIAGRRMDFPDPPRSIRRIFWAATRQYDKDGGVVWLFPQEAGQAFFALDPRETVRIELRESDPSAPVRFFVMAVGDHRAARDFSAIPLPQRANSR